MAAYLFAEVTKIVDAEKYQRYIDAARPLVEQAGGEYLAVTDHAVAPGAASHPVRVVLIRFPSRAAMEGCFGSPEYRAIAPLREHSIESRALVFEGE